MNPLRNRVFAGILFVVMAGVAGEFLLSMREDQGKEFRKDVFGAVAFAALAVSFLGMALQRSPDGRG